MWNPPWGRGAQRPRPPRRAVLEIEVLEGRTLPSVFTPLQIRHAYGLDQVTFRTDTQTVLGDGRGQTIAIVTAYDHPTIQNDLRTFDRAFGLADPPSFVKATPFGRPATNPAWALETALDVEWAHAIAPRANVLLVEAASDDLGDLLQAVDYARHQPGVSVVSMSWGVSDFQGSAGLNSWFATPAGHAGITFVAASGDNGAGYGPSWPAVSTNVLGVGGTTLTTDAYGNYRRETGWSGSGGGYSGGYAAPPYQAALSHSIYRGSPDVAYAGDPNTAFYVYSSVRAYGWSGWFGVGGTSAGTPQWAGLLAIADQGRALAGRAPLDGPTQTLPALYQLAATGYATYFHDVIGGSNGYPATAGYDLVTGLGSPRADRLIGALVTVTGGGSAVNFVAAPAAGGPRATTYTVTAAAAVPGGATSENVAGMFVATPAVPLSRTTPPQTPAAAPPSPPVTPPARAEGYGWGGRRHDEEPGAIPVLEVEPGEPIGDVLLTPMAEEAAWPWEE